MIERVIQRGMRDCGVACLVMVTGRLYEDVARDFPEAITGRGATVRGLIAWLRGQGYIIKAYYGDEVEYSLVPENIKGVAIAAVHIGHGMYHAVVFDNGRVLDPAPLPYLEKYVGYSVVEVEKANE